MNALKKKSSGWKAGVLVLMGGFMSCVAGDLAKPPTGAAVPQLSSELPKGLNPAEIRVAAEVARKIEATMTARASSQKTRDPDGRLGIFIDCAQSFLTPANAPGMDVRKTWVLLAVFAAVTSTEGSPVVVDYIGFTDPEGANGKRWFYELDMSAARQVQKDIFTGSITMEHGYDKIVAAWRRVTRT